MMNEVELSKEKSGPKLKKDRGTNDDMQVIKEIVADNIGLNIKVLDKLRLHLATKDRTLFDIAKDNRGSQRKSRDGDSEESD